MPLGTGCPFQVTFPQSAARVGPSSPQPAKSRSENIATVTKAEAVNDFGNVAINNFGFLG